MQNLCKRLIFILLGVSMVVVSCRQQGEPATWDVDVLVPLAEGRLQLEDMVEDDRLVQDSRGLFRYVHEEEVFDIGLDSLVGIPDTTITENYAIPIGGLFIYGGQPFQSEVNETRYDLKDVELVEAVVRTSAIEVKLRNTLDARMLFRYRINSASKDGLVFQVEEFIDANSSLTRNYTLDGYTLDLRGENNNAVNTLTTEIVIMLDPADSAYQLQAGDQFSIENTFREIVPSYARGYFGQRSFEVLDTSIVEGFAQVPEGMIDFTAFEVSLDIENRIGADLILDVASIGSLNDFSAASAQLNHSVVNENLFVGRGTYVSNDFVKPFRESVDFTETNSNLDALIELRPDRFIYDLDILVNPLGNVSYGNDFAVYGHNLTATLRMDVPLIVGLDGLTLVDTFDFAFSREGDDDPLNQVNHGTVKVHLENGYPVQILLQLYLQDEQGSVIDSLFTAPEVVASATVNANGRVVEPQKSVLEIPVGPDRFDRFEQGRYLRAVARLTTTEADSVSLYNDGFFDLRVVGHLNADVR